jgi:hypothetical protein
MSYFKIGNVDFSHCVNGLKVKKAAVYNSQTNAAGNTVIDYINSKRTIEVGIVPLNEVDMLALLTAINSIGVSISFRNPHTNLIEENVSCVIPESDVEFYTIQANKVMYKQFKLTFTEL